MDHHTKRGTWAVILLAVVVAIASFASLGDMLEDEGVIPDGSCNVAGIKLHGDLYTYGYGDAATVEDGGEPVMIAAAFSEDIVAQIEEAEADEDAKAILVDIDSYGGLPVAAEEVAEALKRADKPTVAVIHQAGTSAAYWAATGADLIIASRNSDVGGIGVTMSYVDEAVKNDNEGLRYNALSSAKYKDMGNPDKEMTEEEKAIAMRDIAMTHENFVDDVARNRELPREAVASLADGASVLGEMAFEQGLIDAIGGLHDAKEHLRAVLGIEPEICWRPDYEY